MWDEILNPFPKFTCCIVKVSEWICNFTLHFMMDVATYSCWMYLIHANEMGRWAFHLLGKQDTVKLLPGTLLFQLDIVGNSE